MKTKFTKKYIIDNKGCYSLKQVNNLSFINNKIISIKDILNSEISFEDKIYFLWKTCNFNYNQRLECYNNSSKIKKIIEKLCIKINMDLVLSSWVFYRCTSWHCRSASARLSKKDKQIIINELLLYIKKFKK